jgi:hypothetical protein
LLPRTSDDEQAPLNAGSSSGDRGLESRGSVHSAGKTGLNHSRSYPDGARGSSSGEPDLADDGGKKDIFEFGKDGRRLLGSPNEGKQVFEEIEATSAIFKKPENEPNGADIASYEASQLGSKPSSALGQSPAKSPFPTQPKDTLSMPTTSLIGPREMTRSFRSCRSCCVKASMCVVLVSATAAVVALQLTDVLPETFKDEYLYACYLPVFNFLLILALGRMIVLSMIYPYQTALLRDSLDRFNNKRLAEETMHLLRGFPHTLRLTSGLAAPAQSEIASE